MVRWGRGLTVVEDRIISFDSAQKVNRAVDACLGLEIWSMRLIWAGRRLDASQRSFDVAIDSLLVLASMPSRTRSCFIVTLAREG